MQESLQSFTDSHKTLLEDKMREYVNQLEAPSIIKESMLYSLEAGGKRIRPLLLFATLAAFNQDTKIGLNTAAALEMVHTYSLIHDDLPSMDDDDLRRGKPTNHKVFGEAYAVLAGDALLTYSFQLIAETSAEDATADAKLAIIKEFSKAAGAEGMVGGQVADIDGEEKQLSLPELEYIHVHKTGKLLAFGVIAGAILSGADEEKIHLLTEFAMHLGLAFQIRDDILDLEGSVEMIGKPVGSDEVNHKSTYPSLLTMDGAKKALVEHTTLAKAKLAETGLNTFFLEEITDMLAVRNH
ncbi:geranylgeranyl diphosphate synthase, type II [Cytobacillus horneckiae]|uniref:Farnesyl diphosphate synthase n=1 Tax=Cytobacillus horneckiae TaxID=549687 RepID=A0A2N0Z9M8_9BACI|nr:farnesyl diphosphate synthase [Cytobacillus horneckiae]MBN6888815.1 polyprenyl synthetase family protein [Cytobacillus horneckiae]MEC1155393.1 polyprenyl synthetase family protein [Cytobacillus horneckiae]MED2936555.1 polyprenyl synthetase family protein [Cytobacillus horneckiae]PKG26212.1 polyprenyl synthetase family protein [Cytobacillus horneckiae]